MRCERLTEGLEPGNSGRRKQQNVLIIQTKMIDWPPEMCLHALLLPGVYEPGVR